MNEKKQSDAPIAILVPNLDQQGTQLKRWFQFYFPDTAVHFSLGQPLFNYPLVNHALSFLTLFTNEFTIEQAPTNTTTTATSTSTIDTLNWKT